MTATWGRRLKVNIFGESHGSHIGITIDGLPSGFTIDMEEIRRQMKRRAPGRDKMSTARKEEDSPEIISGIFEGRTTGAPLTMIIKNKDQRSRDYSKTKDVLRPSHADYSARMRYDGYNDYRGGGHFSGRLTAGLVFAGSIARQILEKKNIHIGSHIRSVMEIEDAKFTKETLDKGVFEELSKERLPLLEKDKEKYIENKVAEAKKNLDSVGGKIEVATIGLKAGIGDPFFESLESIISSMMFSIPAVKGIEFGSGFDLAKMYASEANDEFYIENGEIKTYTNHNGGINGGISNGMPLVFTLAIKPTPSIARVQNSVNMVEKKNTKIEIQGRHDPIILPRAIPVAEAACAIAILDCLMMEGRVDEELRRM